MANGKRYEQWEIDFIKENYSDVSIQDIADFLGRMRSGVYMKAFNLGRKVRPDKAIWNKVEWTKGMIGYLKRNYKKKTNPQIAKALGLTLTVTRNKLYELQLYKLELEYWTDEQTEFLKANYKISGDTELTEMFNERWEKKKGWTKKHIEKKRRYLKLKRTSNQKADIMQRNLDQGRLNTHMHKGKSNFLTSGPAKQGEIRLYKSINGIIEVRVRVGQKWEHWPRWAWEKKHGKIATGMVVIFRDRNNMAPKISNLELVTKEECAIRNASQAAISLSDKYVAAQMAYRKPELRKELLKHPHLLEIKRQSLILRRTLNEKRKNKRAA